MKQIRVRALSSGHFQYSSSMKTNIRKSEFSANVTSWHLLKGNAIKLKEISLNNKFRHPVLLLYVTHWTGDNTELSSNSNISKSGKTKWYSYQTISEEYSISFLMISSRLSFHWWFSNYWYLKFKETLESQKLNFSKFPLQKGWNNTSLHFFLSFFSPRFVLVLSIVLQPEHWPENLKYLQLKKDNPLGINIFDLLTVEITDLDIRFTILYNFLQVEVHKLFESISLNSTIDIINLLRELLNRWCSLSSSY